LHHVGVVVRDMDKAIAHLESKGFGPFQSLDGAKYATIPFKGEFRGRPEEWKVKVSNGQMGDALLELLEPCGGKSVLQEFLDTGHEGLHHIGFLVNDLDGEIARETKGGARVSTLFRRPSGGGFVYFEPTSVGELIIELRKL